MNEVPWWLAFIVSWLPFLILIAMAAWMTVTLRRGLRTRDGRSLAQVVDDHAREMQRANDLLRDAIEAQRRRLEALEQKS
jgi:hypothetical protein